MLIPLGTDRPLRRTPVVTSALLAINIAVFLAQTYLQTVNADEYQQAWLPKVWAWKRDFHWWSLITASFLHADFLHILGNSLFLWVFGPNIEDRLGRLWYLVFYVLGGMAAMGLHVLFSTAPAIGASGSIAALTGAYLVMFPRTQIRVYSILNLGLASIPAWWFIGLSVVWDLAAQGLGARTGIAHLAHLGGYAFGASVSYGLLAFKIIPGEVYDLFFMSKQAKRRAEIRGATRAFERKLESKLAPMTPEAQAEADALALKRSGVTQLVASANWPGAIAAYKNLANTYGHLPHAAVLSRRHQYDLANHMYQAGEYVSAAYAYERFLATYPKDPEAPQICLLLGRINARHLNDPIKAKTLLHRAIEQLQTGSNSDEGSLALARQELADLG